MAASFSQPRPSHVTILGIFIALGLGTVMIIATAVVRLVCYSRYTNASANILIVFTCLCSCLYISVSDREHL